MLELLTGQPAVSPSLSPPRLVDYVAHQLPRRARDICDPFAWWPIAKAEGFATWAMRCVAPCGSNRPGLVEVR